MSGPRFDPMPQAGLVRCNYRRKCPGWATHYYVVWVQRGRRNASGWSERHRTVCPACVEFIKARAS